MLAITLRRPAQRTHCSISIPRTHDRIARRPRHCGLGGVCAKLGASPRNAQFWGRFVRGASWRAPEGPGSSLDGRAQHPEAHSAYEDPLAYAEWAAGAADAGTAPVAC
jgi:hypothetical protein